MKKHLHIVCLDTPWPADYGGAIDMMNRIMTMKKANVAIHLHYFSYNERGTPNELNQFCEQIHVYERKTGRSGVSARLPYIVLVCIFAQEYRKNKGLSLAKGFGIP